MTRARRKSVSSSSARGGDTESNPNSGPRVAAFRLLNELFLGKGFCARTGGVITGLPRSSTTPCSLLSRIPQLTSFDPTCSPVKPRKHSNQFMRDAFIDVACTESLLSLSESDSFRKSSGDYSSAFKGRGPKGQRPKLGSSTSNLSEAVFVKERSKPVITPPVRAQNPLPRNISFNNRKAATRGPEFGLLSVSPPRADDEDTLLRRARVKSKKSPIRSIIKMNLSPSLSQKKGKIPVTLLLPKL